MSEEQRSSLVGVWKLASCKPEPAESTFSCGMSPFGNETSLADDTRKLVDPQDIQPGGKYYSIVKLQIRYDKQKANDDRWAQGSGWLIRPDLLVTAGHCAFDHTYGLGRAKEIRVYVGYAGKSSIGKPGVQFREGATVLTTTGWLTADANRRNDVAFISLNRAFDHITPIKYQATPRSGTMSIGVVGYPADKTYMDEPAARMYAQYKEISWNLDSTFLNMLEYTISSYGGQSGSPVIIQDMNTSIGTHVYGLGTKNSASVIRGSYGNYYRSYVNALSGNIPAPAPGKLWAVVETPAAEDALTESGETEGFWDTFKKVASIGSNIGKTVLGVASPFLGPVGTPIAAIAGGALGVIGKLAGESSMEPTEVAPVEYKEPMCRAILAEAAFQTIMKMDKDTAAKYGLLEKMETRFKETKGLVPAMAKTIQPAIMGPALRIALDSTIPTPRDAPYPAVPHISSTESTMGGQADELVAAVTQIAQSQGETEGFFDFLGPVVNIATKALPIVGNVIGGIIGAVNGEAALEPIRDDIQPHVETLCHRALLGDAALDALLKIPVHEMQQEGFLSSIIDTAKSIGRSVIRVAPSVIRVVEPIVHDLIQKKLNGSGEAQPATGGFTSGTGFNAGGFTPARSTGSTPGPPINKKKSLHDLLNDPTAQPPSLGNVSSGFTSNGSSGYTSTGFNSNGYSKAQVVRIGQPRFTMA